MSFLTNMLIFIVLVWASVYTTSYARWTWKTNKYGAIAVFILVLAVILLPVYALFFKN